MGDKAQHASEPPSNGGLQFSDKQLGGRKSQGWHSGSCSRVLENFHDHQFHAEFPSYVFPSQTSFVLPKGISATWKKKFLIRQVEDTVIFI